MRGMGQITAKRRVAPAWHFRAGGGDVCPTEVRARFRSLRARRERHGSRSTWAAFVYPRRETLPYRSQNRSRQSFRDSVRIVVITFKRNVFSSVR